MARNGKLLEELVVYATIMYNNNHLLYRNITVQVYYKTLFPGILEAKNLEAGKELVDNYMKNEKN